MNRTRCLLFAGLSAVLLAPSARADVKLPALFSDNMVLQQGVAIPVWGWAEPGEEVEVKLAQQIGGVGGAGQAAKSTADKDGKWRVNFSALKATPGATLNFSVKGKNEIVIKNVVLGEVWICSGQSNMEWSVNASAGADEAKKAAKNPNIRLIQVPNKRALEPQKNFEGKWVEADEATIGNWTAVGYYFGRDLNKALNVPIGLIQTDWGGTAAEAWTSREALLAKDDLRHYIEKIDAARKSYDPEKAKKQYEEALAKWKEAAAKHRVAVEEAKKAGKPAPKGPGNQPQFEEPGLKHNDPTNLYNAMIAPLIPYPIKGAIWYQGESNAGKAYEYRTLMPTMIEDWRTRWGNEFPFYMVQLAPYMKIVNEPTESNWAELREAQLMTTAKLKQVGMAVITDVGEENDIHPKKKEPVGARLALAARATAYGEKIEYSGPVFKSMKVEGNKAVLSFDHVAGGLEVKGDKLTGFTIAGEDKKFHNAEAVIKGDEVVVTCSAVEKPTAVRFGWANYPVVNLWNKAGLPATPFRTDDWPGVTQSKKK